MYLFVKNFINFPDDPDRTSFKPTISYNSTVFTSPMWHLTCRLHGPRCARRLSFLSRVTWAARDAYSVMGLDRSATPQEVKERFRTLAKLLGAHGEVENIGFRVLYGRGSLRAQDASATLRPPWRIIGTYFSLIHQKLPLNGQLNYQYQ